MKTFTTFRRLQPNTVEGERIEVKTVYSSHNIEEIDEIEEKLKADVGDGVVVDYGKTNKH